MDYKKKYEQALENIKKIKAANKDNNELVDFIEYEYPELKESEDERVKKIIKNTLQSYNRGIIVCSLSARDYADCLSWLEKQGEQNIKMIQWKGDNLREVVEFTGKSPKFNEWFKTWDDFENYVHSHGNIFKLFCEDGSHYEVPVGAWIVKTPDGYNVASKATYVKRLSEKHGCFIIDKKLLNEVIECLKYTNYWVCGGNDEIINKLKHLKPQPADKQGEQNPAWSEEDERMLQNILECLKNGWRKLPTDILKYESWLKSLKERIKGE